ncbi:MAG: hypothetical protein GXY08_06225 [Ruminococcus sp.]|nr:hypothetical protein [Ruminococcus sp.]
MKQLIILIAVKFTTYLASENAHEPLTDLFNGWGYGVNFIGETLSISKVSRYTTVFFIITLISLDCIADLTLVLKELKV